MLKKRFIAGAVCPQCREVDTTVVELDDGEPQRRYCVRCNFEDDGLPGAGTVPAGRHDKTVSEDSEVSPVRIQDDL